MIQISNYVLGNRRSGGQCRAASGFERAEDHHLLEEKLYQLATSQKRKELSLDLARRNGTGRCGLDYKPFGQIFQQFVNGSWNIGFDPSIIALVGGMTFTGQEMDETGLYY